MATGGISIEGLHKSFGTNHVLKGIDLHVEPGSVVSLLGPNGAGKTTTVRILSTLLAPDAGKVTVNGFDVVREAKQVRSSIGLSGQSAAVDENLSGFDNLEMVARLYRLTRPQARDRATELLDRFELDEAAGRQVKTYSGGMRRRLDLAAALIAEPPVIFLDEPTTGLDPRSRLAMWDTISSLSESGVTVLLTTQYLEEADRLADRIWVIDRGDVIAEGTSDELKDKVGGERLDIAFADDAGFQAAPEIVRAPVLATDAKRRLLSVSMDEGARELRLVLTRLEEAQVAVESVSLHRPTLDDVFLSLTGHQAEAEEESEVSS